MPTAIGTVLASARGAEWVHAAPPSQREGNCSEQGHHIAGHHFVLFWDDPAHVWYHHCGYCKADRNHEVGIGESLAIWGGLGRAVSCAGRMLTATGKGAALRVTQCSSHASPRAISF
jgi:hypothetical protein